MHAKYEVSISYGSEVMAKVKVFLPQTHVQDKSYIPQIPFGKEGGKKITACVAYET